MPEGFGRNRNTLAAAVLVDEAIRGGLRDVVIAPGSRSAPLALALHARPELCVRVVHDERTAAFLALGIGLRTGRPALMLCTSGTAGAHAYPAVLEAEAAAVPLIIATADRPPMLQDVGAPQTMDQVHLFGRHTVRTIHLPPPEATDAHLRWLRGRVARLFDGAADGPAHLNVAYDEPLAPIHVEDEVSDALLTGAGARGRDGGRPWASIHDPTVRQPVEIPLSGPGLVVVGPRPGRAARGLLDWARHHAVPVFADVLSGLRGDASVLRGYDAFLRDPTVVDALRPHWVVRVGRWPTSKHLGLALARWDAETIVVGPEGVQEDPHHLGGTWLRGHTPPWASFTVAGPQRAFFDAVATVDSAVGRVREAMRGQIAEARIQSAAARVADTIFFASSMPVRDGEAFLDQFGGNVFSNRGVNGIDGLVATARGISTKGSGRTIAIVGDVGAAHDSSSLLSLGDDRPDLCVVIVHNDGGAIFSYLPVARAADAEAFTDLFTTAHGRSFEGLCASARVPFQRIDLRDATAPCDLGGAFRSDGGPRVVEIVVDPKQSLSQHLRFWQEAAAAARSALTAALGV